MSNLERFRENAMKELEQLTSKGNADVNTAQAVAIYGKAIKCIDELSGGSQRGYSGYYSGYQGSNRSGYEQTSRDGGSGEQWGNSRGDGFEHKLRALLAEMERR